MIEQAGSFSANYKLHNIGCDARDSAFYRLKRQLFLQKYDFLKKHSFFYFDGQASWELSYFASLAKKNNLGSFLIIADYGQRIENYRLLLQALYEAGFAVIIFEWPNTAYQSGFYNSAYNKAVPLAKAIEPINFLIKMALLPDYKPPYYLLSHGIASLITLAAPASLSSLLCANIHLEPAFYYQKQRVTKLKFWQKLQLKKNRPRQNVKLKAALGRDIKYLLQKIYETKIIEQNQLPQLFFHSDNLQAGAELIGQYAKILPFAHAISIKTRQNEYCPAFQQFWQGLLNFCNVTNNKAQNEK